MNGWCIKNCYAGALVMSEHQSRLSPIIVDDNHTQSSKKHGWWNEEKYGSSYLYTVIEW